MLRHQLLNYFDTETRHVSGYPDNSAEFLIAVKALQCGDGIITILPSVIYLVGIALLVHHIITMNIRPQLYRRVGRELLLQVPWQGFMFSDDSSDKSYVKLVSCLYLSPILSEFEILILMLIYQCVRIWLSTLAIMNTIFKFYNKQLISVCPTGITFSNVTALKLNSISDISKCCCDSVKIPFIIFYILTGLAPFNNWFDVTNVKNLHPLVLLFLVPKFMKVCVCTALSLLPLLALYKLKERRPLPQFMLWMGPVRRDRSELGASGYYLERPFSESVINSSAYQVKRSNSCSDVNNSKLTKPKRLRARKSVSV